MNYDLSRIDYTISGITFPDTLKILPASGPKTQQKFTVGDKNGVLQCLSIKDEEPIVQFKTLPGKPITSVQLASASVLQGSFGAWMTVSRGAAVKHKHIALGIAVKTDARVSAPRSPTRLPSVCEYGHFFQEDRQEWRNPGKAYVQQWTKQADGWMDSKTKHRGSPSDKIFAASGNEVKGYTRKGKVFLTIETSLSETITSMCVAGGDLILGSGRMVTHYRDLQEFHSYVCDDRVLDIAAFIAPNSTRLRLLALIANKGAVILESGQVAVRVVISSGPSRLAVPPWLHSREVCTFYGAADGSIGIISYEGSDLSSKCLVEGGSLGSVMCIGWFFSNSAAHLAVGRHDGSIQLYLVDTENLSETPRLKYTYFCGEPVTSVNGGCVGTEEDELLAATFSGRIFALRSRRLISGAVSLANISQDALAARRSKLESEVARLEKQAANEREKYQRCTKAVNAGLSAPPLLDIQCELSGATRDGWQEARVTSAVPLDMLFLYCHKKLDLETDSAAVLSTCPSQGSSGDLLATVRCQAGTRRLWVRLRARRDTSIMTSHQSTNLLIYSLPAGAPRVARLITLQLPAFPYYSQHEDPEAVEDAGRPWCELRVSGSFSVAEMTSWLSAALPGDLPRPSSSVSFGRIHTLLRTILICRYQRGLATLKCDNVSTICVLKDIISNCSIDKSIRVEITCDIPEDCCIKSFESIEENFKNEYQKHEDISLMKAMSSLDLDVNAINEEDPVLCEEYLRVWKMLSDDIETNFDELLVTVENWYTDWRKLSLHAGDSVNEKSLLSTALRKCSLAEVKQILTNKPFSPN